jgi:hypothetical protein
MDAARDGIVAVRDELRYTQRATGVTRCRLDPDFAERTFAQNSTVAHTIERNTAGQAKIRQTGEAVRGARHAQHDLFANILYRARQIQLTLRE